MSKKPKTSNEMLQKFMESVSTLLEDIDKKYDELGKANRAESSFLHYTEKMIRKWFYSNGGL